jgi:ribonuclease VapC
VTTVVDASVVLAWLQDESGADEAEPLLMKGLIGAANWSEVMQKVRQHRAPVGVVARLLASFGLTVVEVTRADAEIAADLWQRGAALSLADRLCLALGVRANLPVATADAAWTAIDAGAEVILVR